MVEDPGKLGSGRERAKTYGDEMNSYLDRHGIVFAVVLALTLVFQGCGDDDDDDDRPTRDAKVAKP